MLTFKQFINYYHFDLILQDYISIEKEIDDLENNEINIIITNYFLIYLYTGFYDDDFYNLSLRKELDLNNKFKKFLKKNKINFKEMNYQEIYCSNQYKIKNFLNTHDYLNKIKVDSWMVSSHFSKMKWCIIKKKDFKIILRSKKFYGTQQLQKMFLSLNTVLEMYMNYLNSFSQKDFEFNPFIPLSNNHQKKNLEKILKL